MLLAAYARANVSEILENVLKVICENKNADKQVNLSRLQFPSTKAEHIDAESTTSQHAMTDLSETLEDNVYRLQNVKSTISEACPGTEKFMYGDNALFMYRLSELLFLFMKEIFPLKAENKHYGSNDALVPEKKLGIYSQKNKNERSDKSYGIYSIMNDEPSYLKASRQSKNPNQLPELVAQCGRIYLENREKVTLNCGGQAAVIYYLLTNTFKFLSTGRVFIDYIKLEEKTDLANNATDSKNIFRHNLIIIRDKWNERSPYQTGFEGCL